MDQSNQIKREAIKKQNKTKTNNTNKITKCFKILETVVSQLKNLHLKNHQ